MATNVGIKELLESGVHFGHQTRRWNPKMKRFIFDARNGIHIIDLSQTVTQLETACNFLSKTVLGGGKVLFVGTKKQAQQAVKEAAIACGQYHITERWLGGTLTNLKTIKRSLARLRQIEKMDADGSIKDYVKQEQAMIHRESARLVKNLDGVRTLEQQPDAMFIVDIKREHNAVAEGRRLGIPIVAIVDTNADPDLVDYPIAANDDAIRSLRLILTTVTNSVQAAKAEFEAKNARRKRDEEEKRQAQADAKSEAAAAPAVEAPATTTA